MGPGSGETIGLMLGQLGGEVGLVQRDQGMDVQHVPRLRGVDPPEPEMAPVDVPRDPSRPVPKREEYRPIAHVPRVRQGHVVAPRRDRGQVAVRLLAYPHNAFLGWRQD